MDGTGKISFYTDLGHMPSSEVTELVTGEDLPKEKLYQRQRIFTSLSEKLISMNRFLELDPSLYGSLFPQSWFTPGALKGLAYRGIKLGYGLTSAFDPTGCVISLSGVAWDVMDVVAYEGDNKDNFRESFLQKLLTQGENANSRVFKDVFLRDIQNAVQGVLSEWSKALKQYRLERKEAHLADTKVLHDALAAKHISPHEKNSSTYDALTTSHEAVYRSWTGFGIRMALHAGFAVSGVFLAGIPWFVGSIYSGGDVILSMLADKVVGEGVQQRLEALLAKLFIHEQRMIYGGVPCDMRKSEDTTGFNPVCRAAYPNKVSVSCRQDFAFFPDFSPRVKSPLFTEIAKDSSAGRKGTTRTRRRAVPVVEPKSEALESAESTSVLDQLRRLGEESELVLGKAKSEFEGDDQILPHLLMGEINALVGKLEPLHAGDTVDPMTELIFQRTSQIMQDQSIPLLDRLLTLRRMVKMDERGPGEIDYSAVSDVEQEDALHSEVQRGRSPFEGRCDTLVSFGNKIPKFEIGEPCLFANDCKSAYCHLLAFDGIKQQFQFDHNGLRRTLWQEWPKTEWPQGPAQLLLNVTKGTSGHSQRSFWKYLKHLQGIMVKLADPSHCPIAPWHCEKIKIIITKKRISEIKSFNPNENSRLTEDIKNIKAAYREIISLRIVGTCAPLAERKVSAEDAPLQYAKEDEVRAATPVEDEEGEVRAATPVEDKEDEVRAATPVETTSHLRKHNKYRTMLPDS
eukprot:g4105.t1